MISYLKNNDGFITAFIEWDILDFRGQFSSNGNYICVREAWVHESLRNGKSFKELCLKIYEHEYSQKAEFVYWEEFRVNGRKLIDLDKNKKYMAIHKNRKPVKKEIILNKIIKKGYSHV